VFRVVLVTDRRAVSDLESAVNAALGALPRGSVAVQLREKDVAGAALLAVARRLRPLCRARAAPLFVNDRADVALAAGADGVHLPSAGLPVSVARELLGPGRLVGISCHSAGEAAAAHRAGADFAFFGPVWETPGKNARGEAALVEAVRAAAIPVFAIGGVTAPRAVRARAAGAHGVACIRSVLGAADAARAAADLWRALQS
jgi:thiamine-phosphate pyrophosphorylase